VQPVVNIGDFPCWLQKLQKWREFKLKQWFHIYATAINVDESIIYKDIQAG
jgi:hypothetical protein